MSDRAQSNRAKETSHSEQFLRGEFPARDALFDVLLDDALGAKPIPPRAAPFAREFLQHNYPEMMAAYNDLTKNLESLGHTLVESFFKRGSGEAPLIVLEVQDKETGALLVPNINIFLDAPYDNLREQGSVSQKQVAALPGESKAWEDEIHGKYQLERFSPESDLRMVFFPTSEAGFTVPEHRSTVPLIMRVQMDQCAQQEALRHAEERLIGASSGYSYLYDDLLIPALMSDLHKESSGYSGVREEPEIVKEHSYLRDDRITVTATVRKAHSSQQKQFVYGVTNHNGPYFDIIPS